MKHPVERKVTIGFGVVVVAMLVISYCSILSLQRLGEDGTGASAAGVSGFRDAVLAQCIILIGTTISLVVAVAFLLLIRDRLRQLYQLDLQREKAEAALKESNKELESFAYTISHDLRAPLRIMRGFAQVLEEDHGECLPEDGRACVRRIYDAAQRMDLLIHDLLDYSRVTREKIELVPVDMDKVFADVCSGMEVTIRETGAVVSKPEPLLHVLAHARMVRQILENLVSNAIKFVPAGKTPEIIVRTHPHDDFVRIEVCDRGIGVEPSYQEKIFKVFERLHGVEIYPGTGIGLAIVRKASERMGGRCGVESKLGEGSIFWFDLQGVPKTARQTHEGKHVERGRET